MLSTDEVGKDLEKKVFLHILLLTVITSASCHKMSENAFDSFCPSINVLPTSF